MAELLFEFNCIPDHLLGLLAFAECERHKNLKTPEKKQVISQPCGAIRSDVLDFELCHLLSPRCIFLDVAVVHAALMK